MATKSERSLSLTTTSVRLMKSRCSSFIASETRFRIGGIRKSPTYTQFTVRTRMRTFFPSGNGPSSVFRETSFSGARTFDACAVFCTYVCASSCGVFSARWPYGVSPTRVSLEVLSRNCKATTRPELEAAGWLDLSNGPFLYCDHDACLATSCQRARDRPQRILDGRHGLQLENDSISRRS